MKLKRSESKTLEFHHGDAVILVKSEANEDDRLEAVFHSRAFGESWNGDQKAAYCRVACRRMVVGWKNVTNEKGEELSYDFEMLKDLPKLPGKSLFVELGAFILKDTDFQRGASEEIKNA